MDTGSRCRALRRIIIDRLLSGGVAVAAVEAVRNHPSKKNAGLWVSRWTALILPPMCLSIGLR